MAKMACPPPPHSKADPIAKGKAKPGLSNTKQEGYLSIGSLLLLVDKLQQLVYSLIITPVTVSVWVPLGSSLWFYYRPFFFFFVFFFFFFFLLLCRAGRITKKLELSSVILLILTRKLRTKHNFNDPAIGIHL